jgi:linoleoyl-CoA desaturase
MPSNHLAEVGREVQAIAEEYGLPYNTDSFPKQFLQVQKTLMKLSLPNSMLRADASNAPEVRSDEAFTGNAEIAAQTGHRQLRKGLALLKKARPKFLA